jgi:competence protein ComEC
MTRRGDVRASPVLLRIGKNRLGMDWFTASQGRKDDRQDMRSGPEVAGNATAGGATVSAWWQQQRRQQLGRGALWAPVGVVVGLLAYYALPVEPPVAVAVLLALLAGGLCWLCLAGRSSGVALVAAFVLAGFVWGQVSTWLNPVTILPGSTGKVTISGWVEDIAAHSAGRSRLLLQVDAMNGVDAAFVPERLRVTAKAADVAQVRIGHFISAEAWAYPPLTPVSPGAWDYGRVLWFEGIGGSARLAGPVSVDSAKSRPGGMWAGVNGLRSAIASRIRQSLPEREAGFAIALITGERAGLDRETREALQISGLAHILAISGLHMSLVAGGVFWVVRALLALWPWVVLNLPVKKMAALAGLGAAGFYLLISGQAIATQRAFIMLAVMFVAVLAGRSALSMRNLAIAALIVLFVAPEAALSASFQMSFLAVIGLIAAYEAASGWQSRLYQWFDARGPAAQLALRVVIGVLALSATTIVASTFTALPAAWHFNRFATWSLPANLLAMPAVSFVVMPGAVASVLAMPFGLEWWPLQVMRYGLDAVIASALFVASWPGAGLVVPVMVPAFALVSGMGLIWLALWKGGLRWAGAATAMLAAVAGTALSQRPDLIIERSARTMAARLDAGRLVPVHPRRGRYTVERWLLADGDGATLAQAAKREGWTCADNVCRATVAGKQAIWLDRKAKPPGDCKAVAVVVSAEPLRRACGRSGRGRVVIDRFDVWRNGSHAIYVQGDGGLRVQTARIAQGNRPWAFMPVARRKVLSGSAAVSFSGTSSSGSAGATTGAANSGKDAAGTNDQ